MRIRRIAVLIDGGFFIKRLSKLVAPQFCDSPVAVAKSARRLCKRHVQRLTGEPFTAQRSRWYDHVYRLFYYDASPFDAVSHHPIQNMQIQFGKTPEANFRRELFDELRRSRKFVDPLWQSIRADLHEHVDGVVSGIARPASAEETANSTENDDDESQQDGSRTEDDETDMRA
jgi:hypothetical protein